MSITTREKQMLDRFNKKLVEVEAVQQRPSDAELAKMSDAAILAGDWLVDIEDYTFWNRWDEANANLTVDNGVKYYTPSRIEKLVESGKASHWPRKS
jgi:hypothetical protein